MALLTIFMSCATPEKNVKTKTAPEFSPKESLSEEFLTRTDPENAEIIPKKESEPALAEPEDSTQEIMSQVSQLLAERNYAEALLLFNDIEPSRAETPQIQLIKASIYNSSGQSAQAREIANKILSGQPDNIEALLILSASAAVEGKDREQRTTLERIIKIDPKNVKALCDLGYIAMSGKSLRTAANYFERALAEDNTSGEALIGRAIVYRYAHEPKKSEQLLNHAIKLYPQWASPLNERARLYKGAGFLKEALADLDAAKKMEPYNYWISVDRGNTLLELARRQEALEEFIYATTLDPKNFLAYVYCAGIRDEMDDLTGAENDYLMITKLKPEYYFAFEGLGIIKMKKMKWAEARDAFLSAYKYAPKEYTYALLAALNWMRAGKMTDPKQFLAQVLRTAPRDTSEWYMLRLYHDLAGDFDITVRIEKEVNLDNKTRMLFYLANYYDIKGNKILADKCFLQVKELERMGIPEWRLNEWFIKQRELDTI